MKLYKLTDQDGKTRAGYYNECLWGPGVTHRSIGKGELCTNGYIHAYTHPLVAVMMNPIHANLDRPRLWEAEGEIAKTDGFKVGCPTLTTVREIDLPEITPTQRVRTAILCTLADYSEPKFVRWAEGWLSGSDRSAGAASEAAAWSVGSAITDAVTAAAKAREEAWAAWWSAWAVEAAKPLDLISVIEKVMSHE